MNQKNYDYLKDQVKFTGFGDGLEEQLKAQLEKQVQEFKLVHKQAFGRDEASSTLHFKRSDQTDNYFFNSYQLSLKQYGNDQPVNQTFYIDKENNFTLKEAFNLLSGRAVNKDLVSQEGQKYNAWVQLNFKETEASGNFKKQYFNEKYGFDLEKALSAHAIKELSTEEDKNKLIESLQKGNRQAVTFQVDGSEQRRFIEASPKFKSLNVYDSNNQRIRPMQKECQSEGKDKKQELKEGQSAEAADESQKGNRRNQKKGQGIS